jgi:hypothetical protein
MSIARNNSTPIIHLNILPNNNTLHNHYNHKYTQANSTLNQTSKANTNNISNNLILTISSILAQDISKCITSILKNIHEYLNLKNMKINWYADFIIYFNPLKKLY